ncbi:MAG TPA: FAD binding domain-containing protein [Anaerolineales bacterium]
MITDYLRPQSIEQAIDLLSNPDFYPLGGGTLLTQKSDDSFAVVDLQELGLNKIHKVGEKLEIGATVTLSLLLESPHILPALATVLQREGPVNIRNSATVAGSLVSCDGRSIFSVAMLSMDAKLIFTSGVESVTLGNYLPMRLSVGSVHPSLPGKLITKIVIPHNVRFAFETVARTPGDKPIVCAALTRWPSGRTRLALGGYSTSPILALDGNEPGGFEAAARNAYAGASDEWASAEYRSEIAAVLAMRCASAIAIIK